MAYIFLINPRYRAFRLLQGGTHPSERELTVSDYFLFYSLFLERL